MSTSGRRFVDKGAGRVLDGAPGGPRVGVGHRLPPQWRSLRHGAPSARNLRAHTHIPNTHTCENYTRGAHTCARGRTPTHPPIQGALISAPAPHRPGRVRPGRAFGWDGGNWAGRGRRALQSASPVGWLQRCVRLSPEGGFGWDGGDWVGATHGARQRVSKAAALDAAFQARSRVLGAGV